MDGSSKGSAPPGTCAWRAILRERIRVRVCTRGTVERVGPWQEANQMQCCACERIPHQCATWLSDPTRVVAIVATLPLVQTGLEYVRVRVRVRACVF